VRGQSPYSQVAPCIPVPRSCILNPGSGIGPNNRKLSKSTGESHQAKREKDGLETNLPRISAVVKGAPTQNAFVYCHASDVPSKNFLLVGIGALCPARWICTSVGWSMQRLTRHHYNRMAESSDPETPRSKAKFFLTLDRDRHRKRRPVSSTWCAAGSARAGSVQIISAIAPSASLPQRATTPVLPPRHAPHARSIPKPPAAHSIPQMSPHPPGTPPGAHAG